jgi:uroporphyrinogen decarboxylase
MTSHERVAAVIEHRAPDRMPVYGWVRANLNDQLTAAFGSVEAFEDRYEFDVAHLFGGPVPHWNEIKEFVAQHGRRPEPPEYLDIPLRDPNDSKMFERLIEQIALYKGQKGRFVYVQTPGIFECLNGAFGIENHLCHLIEFEDDLQRVYRRQAEWNRTFAMNCLDLGVDMIHVSDDWGAQQDLMFAPEVWWRLIEPNHRVTAEAVRQRGGFLSLHTDGNINKVIPGVIGLGYQVVHPWQESAGMSLLEYKEKYAGKFAVMGGLDIQTTLGFGRLDHLRAEIERVLGLFPAGGLIFCTTHFVQDHCSIEELIFAYDLVYDLVRHPRGKS